MSFKQHEDHELNQLSDEALIAYIRDAAAAGKPDAAKRALGVLVWGHERNVARRLALRLPRHAVEEVTHEVLARAFVSAFDGSSEGEFRSWLSTITERAKADWYRRRERRPDETQLPEEHTGEADAWHDVLGREGEAGAVELKMVMDDEMSKLSPSHKQVVELHLLDQLTAVEVCEQVDGMKADNVAQIASRFRKSLKQALYGEDAA